MTQSEYLKQYDNLIQEAPWYYRLTRFFSQEKLFNEKITGNAGTVASDIFDIINQRLQSLLSFQRENNVFICSLLGVDQLIKATRTLFKNLLDADSLNIPKSQQYFELQAISSAKLVTITKKKPPAELEKHLAAKAIFMSNIPSAKPASLMPEVFARWGKHSEFAAIPVVSAKKPMTYANLIAEQKATEERQDSMRKTMIKKRERNNITCLDMGFFPPTLVGLPFKNSYANLTDPGQKESNAIDETVCVLNHIEKEITNLSKRAIHIEIQEDNKPHVLTPMKI